MLSRDSIWRIQIEETTRSTSQLISDGAIPWSCTGTYLWDLRLTLSWIWLLMTAKAWSISPMKRKKEKKRSTSSKWREFRTNIPSGLTSFGSISTNLSNSIFKTGKSPTLITLLRETPSYSQNEKRKSSDQYLQSNIKPLLNNLSHFNFQPLLHSMIWLNLIILIK